MFHNEDLENAIEPVLQVIDYEFWFQYFMKSPLLAIILLALLFGVNLFLLYKGAYKFIALVQEPV